ncbi:hypothetical protein ACTJJB_01745 [Chitinophaga sp. 22536]|uniref:hypothetical protein n=1 Tax=unclassified Chitinophaga TaxID=2619133 RepID=UPI003F85FCC2
MTYYNTTHLTGRQLANQIKAARGQQTIIAEYFRKHPKKKITASELTKHLKARALLSKRTPITSIRRALSDLKSKGAIQMLAQTRIGPYKQPEHLFQKTTGAGYAEIHPIQQPTLF